MSTSTILPFVDPMSATIASTSARTGTASVGQEPDDLLAGIDPAIIDSLPKRRQTRVFQSGAASTSGNRPMGMGFEAVSFKKEQRILTQNMERLCELYSPS